MATTDIPDFDGVRRSLENPLAPGRAAAAASRPTVLSTEDKTALDAAVTALQIVDDWDESDRAKVNPIVGQAGVAAGAGAVGAAVQRVTLASDDPAVVALQASNSQLPANLGSKSVAASLATSVKSGGNEYETVAASQTTQTIGATGATGDYLEGVLCVVSTAATSQVQIKDGANAAITVLPNNVGAGIGSYYVPLGLTSVAGAWQVTTAAGVSVIATGDFT